MGKTFKEANREVGEERQEERGDLADWEGEAEDYDLERAEWSGKRFKKIFNAFTEDEGRRDRRERVARDFDDEIKISLEEELGVSFDDLNETIGNFGDIDLEGLGQQGLLTVIAEQTNAVAVQLSAVTGQISALAAIQGDIAGSVQIPFGISVSGVNDIDDPEVAQPIVRDSEGGDVEARIMKLKASEENKVPIWIGDENVEVGNGRKLRPGEEYPIELDLTQGQPYMAAEEDAQEIEIIGLA